MYPDATSYRKMSDENSIYGPFIGIMGVVSGIVLSFLGAAYGTVKTAKTVARYKWKSLISLSMALPLILYGMTTTILLAQSVDDVYNYSLYKGFLHLGAGLCVGISCLIAGISIGHIGQSAILPEGNGEKINFGCMMCLNLIFCQTIAFCGFVVSIYIYSK